MLIAFYPILFSGFARSQFDLGDARMNNYVLEHGYRWLTGAHPSFWDPPIFFPAKNVAAYTDVLLGAAPIYWLWRLVGFLPDTAFQLWMLCLSTLNFWMFRLWLRRGLGFEETAAAAGSFLFAFASYRMAQISHIQLYTHFFTILALFALMRGWIPLFWAAAVAQVYAGFYLGWLMAVGFALVACLRPRETWRVIRKTNPWVWGVGALAAAALTYPLVSHSLEAARTVGYRVYEGMDLPRPWSWFYLGPESWLYGWLYRIDLFRSIPFQLEHYLGLGLVTTAAALYGLRGGGRWLLAASTASALLAVAVTRWTVEFSLWKWIYPWIPGADGLRALPRVALLLLIPLCVGFARTVGKWQWGVALLALAILEQGRAAPSFDKLAARVDVEQIAGKVDRVACASFLYDPKVRREPEFKLQIDAMWASLETGVPTVNGYSGNFPPGWSTRGWGHPTCRVL
jgi:hypothetical protein